jgi:hypothetical protein
MNRLAETNVWNDARSYAPDLYDQLAVVEHYERLARKARRRGRFGFANRATREPSRVTPSRPFGRVSAIAWGDILFGAACGLLVGMLATVGLAYIWALFL